MTKNEIEMEFARTLGQAKELAEISEELKRLSVGSLDSILGIISQGWKGENASEFRNNASGINDKLLRIARILGDVSETVNNTAIRIYEAELTAIEICSCFR